MGSTNRIVELSSLIAAETAKINDFLVKNGLPTPSLEADALGAIPIPDEAKDIKAARAAVLGACSELEALLTGPKDILRIDWSAWVSVKAIVRFKLDQSFPVGESTSFEAMSEFSGLTVRNVRRLIRHAIAHHRFFQEKTPGIITHSAMTAILNRDALMRNSFIVEMDEFWSAGFSMADAMEKWPNSEENTEAGFSVANNSHKSMYQIFEENPARGQRFALNFSHPDRADEGLLEHYDWSDKKTMVDVGGSLGSVAIAIAQRHPHIQCFVQDLPDTAAKGAARLPAELQDRVIFKAHDFFTEQQLSADVYYFRYIMHNWADKYAVKILQNLVPALRPGARVVIHELVLQSPENVSREENWLATKLDVGMQQLLNAKQRDIDEWRELFSKADSRYRWLGAYQPPGNLRWVIEAEWQG